MPRRRPVREQRTSRSIPQLAGVSAATTRAITAFEHVHSYPGSVAGSFRTWSRFVRGPARAIVGFSYEDYEPDDPFTSRSVLRMALAALPGKAARELRTLLRPLDELYLARSLPVPEHAHIRELLIVQ